MAEWLKAPVLKTGGRPAPRGFESLLFRVGPVACSKCGRVLPRTAEHFQALATRAIGFESRCLECKSKQNRNRYVQTRLEVLRHYSKSETPFCDCCGETIYEFLTIDHINGGGRAHRKEIHGTFASICQWLKRHDFPDGFRVLCLNCNGALGFYGFCPHQPG